MSQGKANGIAKPSNMPATPTVPLDEDEPEISDIITPKRVSLTSSRPPRPIVPNAFTAPATIKANAAPLAGSATAAPAAASQKPASTAAPATGTEDIPALKLPGPKGTITFTNSAQLRACLSLIQEAKLRVFEHNRIEISTSDREGKEFAQVTFLSEGVAKATSGVKNHGIPISKRVSGVLVKTLQQQIPGGSVTLDLNKVSEAAKHTTVTIPGTSWSNDVEALKAERAEQVNLQKANLAPSVLASAAFLCNTLSQLSQFTTTVDVSIEDKAIIFTASPTLQLRVEGSQMKGPKNTASTRGMSVYRLIDYLRVGLLFNKRDCWFHCGSDIPGVIIRFEGADVGVDCLLKETKKKG